MKLYVYTSDAHGGSRDEEILIKQSIIAYCADSAEKVLEKAEIYKLVQDAEIKREKGGKPYIETSEKDESGRQQKKRPAEFSVSHSGEFFACLVSDKPVGIDIQEIRDADTCGIAGRFFSEEERKYAEAGGEDAFFDIWVRKEALIKCTGKGLSQGLASFSTVKNGVPADEIELEGEFRGKYRLRNIEISPVIKCAVCEFMG